MTRIGIILGSTRPNRNGEQVARWVYDIASRRSDAEFELVDLRDYPTTIISRTTKTLRARSAMVLPASTAERDMGRDRNRWVP